MVSLAILYSVSFISLADSPPSEQNSEPEKISFYGGRVVPHASTDSTKIQPLSSSEQTSAQRRAIHPNSNSDSKAAKPQLESTKTQLAILAMPSVNGIDNTNGADSEKSEKKQNKLAVNNAIKITKPLNSNKPQKSPITTATTTKITKDSNGLTTRDLNREELLLAKKAQYYIERNWNKNTGLIDSVQGYHHATLWDIASGIGAVLALENLNLISSFDATSRLTKTLTTMVKMPLYNDELPNREYNTKTALPSGSLSKTASNGNGWSALDIGRLLIWLEITKQYKPELTPLITLITQKWQLSRAVNKQSLYGELKTKKSTSYRQEGRLGYLQYAAQGYQFSGFDVSVAFKSTNTAVIVQGSQFVYIDQRNLPFFTSDSYVLQAIELGSPEVWWNQLETVYQLHKKNYLETNVLRVFAEDSMNRKPWFSYNNINIYGKPWLSTNTRGKVITNPQLFSNKVAFAFSVLFSDSFSQQLADKVVANSLSQRSVPTGLYKDNAINTAYNINTNSLILVALWFKSRNNTAILNGSRSH